MYGVQCKLCLPHCLGGTTFVLATNICITYMNFPDDGTPIVHSGQSNNTRPYHLIYLERHQAAAFSPMA